MIRSVTAMPSMPMMAHGGSSVSQNSGVFAKIGDVVKRIISAIVNAITAPFRWLCGSNSSSERPQQQIVVIREQAPPPVVVHNRRALNLDPFNVFGTFARAFSQTGRGQAHVAVGGGSTPVLRSSSNTGSLVVGRDGDLHVAVGGGSMPVLRQQPGPAVSIGVPAPLSAHVAVGGGSIPVLRHQPAPTVSLSLQSPMGAHVAVGGGSTPVLRGYGGGAAVAVQGAHVRVGS